MRALLLVSLVAVPALFLTTTYPQHARASVPITVNTTDDESNNDGDCSLREAVGAAESDSARDACPAGSGTDTIMIPAGTYESVDLGGLNTDLILAGAGPDTILDGSAESLLLVVNNPAATVGISDLTMRNGRAPLGGLIQNYGTLTIERALLEGGEATVTAGGAIVNGENATLSISESEIASNVAHGGKGGSGIFNGGNATIIDSVIRDNGATEDGSSGGGITNSEGATLTVQRTLITNNTTDLVDDDIVDYQGGGLMNEGAATLENVTLSGNTAGSGGAIFNRPTGIVGLTNVTIVDNTLGPPTFGADGLQNNSGTIEIANSIIAGAPEPVAGEGEGNNCAGDIVTLGFNIEDGDTCLFTEVTDSPNTEPLLGPLADNDGFSETHAILEGSPAIDAGDDAVCPETDQRGEARPQGQRCDIGAYESSFSAPALIQGDVDCDGDVDAVDALKGLQDIAALPYGQSEPCVNIGFPLVSGFPFGDLDCDGDVDSVDSLQVLRHVAALPVNQGEPCTDPGDPL